MELCRYNCSKSHNSSHWNTANGLFGEKLPTVAPFGKKKTGKASGELVGNLSILYSLFGSPSAIDCSDKIYLLKI
jgi:muramoyltetrapeptide carboxypeptidase LdcA involved in peptidoglycan recycling